MHVQQPHVPRPNLELYYLQLPTLTMTETILELSQEPLPPFLGTSTRREVPWVIFRQTSLVLDVLLLLPEPHLS